MRIVASARRLFIGGVLLLLLAATLVLVSHTIADVARLQTNVLWRDQWWFLGELKSLGEGKSFASLLWSPYWGHRPVIPRLLFYGDARFFAFRNAPLLYLSWIAWLTTIALLLAVNRAIFGQFLSWRFGAALIVTLNLCLSSFHLENLMWALQVQYILVFFFALLSFFLFALSARAGRPPLLTACLLSAMLGSLTMIQGLMIWPALAAQAFLCRRRRVFPLGFLLIFLGVSVIYAAGYRMPDTGMGLTGQLRRPMRALELSLMVLGGPLANQFLGWSVAVGAMGMIALICFAAAVYRHGHPVWPGVHMAVLLFIVMVSSLTVAGRISPELLKQTLAHGGEIMPSRYQTFAILFWTSVFPLALWMGLAARPLGLRTIAAVAALLPCCAVLGYARMQTVVADAWLDSLRAFDATSTSFLVGVSDWDRQKLLWGYQFQLEEWIAFARQHRLTTFSEDRFAWLGRTVAEQFRQADSTRCEGKLEGFEPVTGTGLRAIGWAWDRGGRRAPTDIVLADASGRIRGLGRSGIPHHDTGGHSSEVYIYRAGWLGYIRLVESKDLQGVRAYAVLDHGQSVCPLHTNIR